MSATFSVQHSAKQQVDAAGRASKRARHRLGDATDQLAIPDMALDALGELDHLEARVLLEVPSRPAPTPVGRWTVTLPELAEIARRLNLTPAATPRELEGVSDGIRESIVGLAADSSSAVLILAAYDDGQELDEVIAIRSGSQPLALLLACTNELEHRCRVATNSPDRVSATLDSRTVELKRRQDDDVFSLFRMFRNHRVDVTVRRRSREQERIRDDRETRIVGDAERTDRPRERRGELSPFGLRQSRWNACLNLVPDDQPMAWTELDQDLLPWAPPRTAASFNWDGSPWTGDPLAILSDSELFARENERVSDGTSARAPRLR